MKNIQTIVLTIALIFAVGLIVKLQLQQVNAEKLARFNMLNITIAEKSAIDARIETNLQIAANHKAVADFKIQNDLLKSDLYDCNNKEISLISLKNKKALVE